MTNLHGWVITYNGYTENYIACKRDDYYKLFSNSKDLLKSKSFDTLRELIEKTDGDPKLIKQLTSK